MKSSGTRRGKHTWTRELWCLSQHGSGSDSLSRNLWDIQVCKRHLRQGCCEDQTDALLCFVQEKMQRLGGSKSITVRLFSVVVVIFNYCRRLDRISLKRPECSAAPREMTSQETSGFFESRE